MTDITQLLGKDAESLLQHRCITIPSDQLYLPGADYVDRVMVDNNRPPAVLRNMQTLYNTGRLGGTGYLSILPVDQGVEHSAGASFAANPLYFDPKNIVELAIEAGCNCVASTYGVLASVSRRYAHRIPFLVKLNHNETLSYPTEYDQTLYASVEQAFNMGAVAVGATIYFGSEQSRRQIEEISAAFERAHELGLVTVLWAYLRNSAFKKDGVDYHVSADLTGQANHLAATIGAAMEVPCMASYPPATVLYMLTPGAAMSTWSPPLENDACMYTPFSSCSPAAPTMMTRSIISCAVTVTLPLAVTQLSASMAANRPL